MIEAMATGTPVIAFNQGSISELVKNRVSGFVVSDLEEMIEAVEKLDTIKRGKVREYALSTFNAQRMADAYEAIYQQILSRKDNTVRNQGALRQRSAASYLHSLGKSRRQS
jgi:glycosyltransferase involved in cell wall biosynthesis